ncbi:MAG: hypothetical protein JXR70_07750 [Spirochaetales bacterium]|nr:hypothetical protein [Spirochaetales bacterium]
MKNPSPIVQLFTFPLFWLGIVIIGAFTAFYLWWFPFSVFFAGLLGLADLAALVLLFVLLIQSDQFKSYYHSLPQDRQLRELKAHLEKCPEPFKSLAFSTLDIGAKMKAEFKDEASIYEIDQLYYNVSRLSKNHVKLYKRSLQFGTGEQKMAMKKIIDKQIETIRSTKESIEALSGNLTLLEASSEAGVDDSGAFLEQMKYVNKGMEEVIEEV